MSDTSISFKQNSPINFPQSKAQDFNPTSASSLQEFDGVDNNAAGFLTGAKRAAQKVSHFNQVAGGRLAEMLGHLGELAVAGGVVAVEVVVDTVEGIGSGEFANDIVMGTLVVEQTCADAARLAAGIGKAAIGGVFRYAGNALTSNSAAIVGGANAALNIAANATTDVVKTGEEIVLDVGGTTINTAVTLGGTAGSGATGLATTTGGFINTLTTDAEDAFVDAEGMLAGGLIAGTKVLADVTIELGSTATSTATTFGQGVMSAGQSSLAILQNLEAEEMAILRSISASMNDRATDIYDMFMDGGRQTAQILLGTVELAGTLGSDLGAALIGTFNVVVTTDGLGVTKTDGTDPSVTVFMTQVQVVEFLQLSKG